MHPFLRLFGLAALLALVSGCATSPRTTYTSTASSYSSFSEPVSFSDEESRELVRQTRELMALRDRDYLVGPDDVLEISIFEWELTEQTRTLELRVSKSGVVAIPSLGTVAVDGKSVEEIQGFIVAKLEEGGMLQDPRVAVTVTEYRSKRISVIGSVNSPGVYALHENVSSLMDMLSLAGGPSPDAGGQAVVLRRQGPNEEPLKIGIDLNELFRTGRGDLNAVLRDGDVVFIPEAPQIFVYGQVEQPGAVRLTEPTTLLEALSVAGGFAERAEKTRIKLERKGTGGEMQSVYLNIGRIEKGQEPNPYLRQGDVVYVGVSPAKTFLGGLWGVTRDIVSVTYRLDANDSSD